MYTRFTTLINTCVTTVIGLAMVCGLGVVVPVMAQGGTELAHPGMMDHMNMQAASAQLVEKVRNATRNFLNSPPTGYGQFLGCVSGPEHGAMGIHFVNMSLVADGLLSADSPEALIYEPQPGGKMRLVGVEFIVDAKTWLANNNNQPPVLEGQSLQYVGKPNRYALDPFFELHVWAWRDSPTGTFVDWNNHVSCDAAKGE